jgi:MYXO-CTERM domain-containing protein
MTARAVLVLGALVLSTPNSARADGVRYDGCSVLGERCDNAIAGHRADDPDGGFRAEEAVERGTCENAKCQRPGPGGSVIVLDCRRCIESDEDDDQGCSCRATGVAPARALAAVMLLAGVAAFSWSRRRRG